MALITKGRVNRFIARMAHKYGQRFMSDTGKMLLNAIHMKEGDMSYMLSNTVREWIENSDSWVDRQVLTEALAEHLRQRLRNLVLVNVTNGWTNENEGISISGAIVPSDWALRAKSQADSGSRP